MTTLKKKHLPLAAACFCALALAMGGYYYSFIHGASNANGAQEGTLEDVELSKAKTVTGIENVSLDGKTVNFTIPEGAKDFDESSQGALAGMYDVSRDQKSGCLQVPSTVVSKEVKDYDMVSGQAKIVAHFDNPDDAKTAVDAGCLLIDDRQKG